MNYKIQAYVWNIGADLADELTDKMADLLASYGLALPEDAPTDERIQSMVTLEHAGEAMELDTPADVLRFMNRATARAQMILIPAEPKTVKMPTKLRRG